MATAKTQKKSSTKNTKFQFSWMKLLVGFSFALNLAFIVFVYSLLKTSYFDFSLMNKIYRENLDDQGCFISTELPDDKNIAKVCLITVGVDNNGKIDAPEWLKGQTFPDAQ